MDGYGIINGRGNGGDGVGISPPIRQRAAITRFESAENVGTISLLVLPGAATSRRNTRILLPPVAACRLHNSFSKVIRLG